MANKKLIYVPSFNAGGIATCLKSKLYHDEKTVRWWTEDTPEKYRTKAMLIPAGHEYKRMDYIQQFNFPEDMLVLGDSGGYQVITGLLKYTDELRVLLFNWLERNSTVAINLDIPPYGAYKNKYAHCLEQSYKNYKYFADNQTGATKFLNVMHGFNTLTFKRWYDVVKGFDFNGWAFNAKGVYGILAAFAVFLDGKEHLNKNNEYFHLLGATSITEMIVLSYVQKKFNELGLSATLMTDSSSPSMSAKFGNYFVGFDLKARAYSSINVPRHRDLVGTDSVDIYADGLVNRIPMLNEYDEYLFEKSWIDVDRYSSIDYGLITVHNLGIFLDCFKSVDGFINTNEYFYTDIFGPEMTKILKTIDQIFESNNPISTFEKNAPLYSAQNKNSKVSFIDHSFFNV